MNWTYAYTPHIWVPFGTVLLTVALAIFSWRRRSVPGARPFTLALLFAALWAAGTLMEYTASDPATKIGWIKFQAAWQLPSAIAISSFLLEYTWPGRWLTRRNVTLLSTGPLLLLLVILTNNFHHLMWRSFSFSNTLAAHQIVPSLGPVGWIGVAYGYALVVLNFIVFAWLFRHSPQHRWFVALMVIGQLGIRAAYLMERTKATQSSLPLEMIGIVFAYLMYTYTLFRYHVLDSVQLAHQAVLAQMREGMLVLDAQGRVARLNPAAVSILGLRDKQVLGHHIQKLIPAYPDLPKGERAELEITLAVRANTRSYLLAIGC